MIDGWNKRTFCLGAACMAAVVCLFLLSGCASLEPPTQNPAFHIGGLWQGELRALPGKTIEGRPGAVNKITLIFRQAGSQIRGDYRCAYGNTVCRDANKTQAGQIVTGTLGGTALYLRVFYPYDLSSCLFNGRVSESVMAGSYRCYQGGGVVEQGIWRTSRVSSDLPAAAGG